MKKLMLLVCLFAVVTGVAQQRVEYDITITDTLIGRTHAMAINGRIPAPTLEFTEGDTAVLRIHNHAANETSLHWHGIIVPNQFDGVPYLTSAPIMPGTSITYEFPIRQSGTYWYHSHTGLQEQMGLYGAFVIHKREAEKLPERVVMLSDRTNMDPMEVNRKLHTGTDWFKIKKGSVQSYGEALVKGHFVTKLASEWKRMDAMDVSDIYYEHFLANGSEQIDFSDLVPGTRVRLRIINGGSATYFLLRYGGGRMTVVANDGMDVEPVEVDRLMIAVSETYDVVVSVPKHGAAELQATAEDRSGHTSIWVGGGMKHALDPLPKPDYFAGMRMMNGMMRMNGDIDNHGMKMSLQKMDMNEVMYPELAKPMVHKGHQGHSMDMNMGGPVTLNYDMLRSPVKTTLPDGPWREMRFELTGNMDRFVWTMNGKTISESDKIMIREGENLRITLYNNSMMRHPMHLHGHFFRLVNSHGEHSPLKFGLDIMPGETDTIEFHAGERSRGDWFFHCHLLYHMMSGMGRIFSYEDTPFNPQLPDPAAVLHKVYHGDRMWYFTARNDFMTSGNRGRAELFNTRWSVQGEWNAGYRRHQEVELRAGRYLGRMQWLMPFVGADWSRGVGFVGTAGVRYTLPMLITAEARIDHRGHARLQLEREDIPLTNRLRMDLAANTDREYNVGLNYIILPWLGISGSYNSDLGWGIGLRLTY